MTKREYDRTEEIQIWSTLIYQGSEAFVRIWHGDPSIVFSITNDEGFRSDGFVQTSLTSTPLAKETSYRFAYQKSGGYDANDPNANFGEQFYREKELRLPPGEYTITIGGTFSLSEQVIGSESGLLCQIEIKVV